MNDTARQWQDKSSNNFRITRDKPDNIFAHGQAITAKTEDNFERALRIYKITL